MSSDTLYDIIFLRHGESAGNAQGLIQGQVNLPLTETGIAQAQALAMYWRQKSIGFDCILSSPLERARQTAQIIADALNAPVEYDSAWMERDFGDIEGQFYKEILLHEAPPDFYHPFLPAGNSGESMIDLNNRAHLAIQNLFRHDSGRYLVVSHGALLNAALAAIFGVSPITSPRSMRFYFHNTGYAKFTYDTEIRQWRLLEFNANYHLHGPVNS